VPIWLMVIVFAAAWYLLNHTRFGRYVYALGGNESATRLSGINVDRVKIGVYAICGFLSALAGIIITSRLSSAQPTAGMGNALNLLDVSSYYQMIAKAVVILLAVLVDNKNK